MKLSMQIILDELKEFQPKATIKSNLFDIEAVRLFAPNATLQSNTLYVGRLGDLFVTDSRKIMCAHGNDIILLETEDLESVLNQILNTLAMFSMWENEMMSLINSGGMLQDLMDASAKILQKPVMILNQAQRLLAYNKDFQHEDVDPMWNQIMREGSNSLADLMRINRHDIHRMEKVGLYTYDNEGVFPSNSWHYNFAPQKNFVGSATIIEPHNQFTEGELNRFLLFCQYVEQWFLVHLQDQQYIILDNLLTHAITTPDADSAELIRMLMLMNWKSDDSLIIYKIDPTNPTYNINRYLCNSLNLSLQGAYAITHGLSICLLCNLSINSQKQLEEQLLGYLKTSVYYATLSQIFTMSDSLYEHYQYVSIISQYADHNPGSLNLGENYVMDYFLEKMQQTGSAKMLHPAIFQLAAYDEAHNTEFFDTLYVYIKNGRRFADTVEELHLHRNTLKYRLKRLQEILDLDLDQASTRLHLWLSFEIYSKQK